MLPNHLVTVEYILKELLTKLRCSAGELGLTKLKLAMNDDIFNYATSQEMFAEANTVLKNLTIILVQIAEQTIFTYKSLIKIECSLVRSKQAHK